MFERSKFLEESLRQSAETKMSMIASCKDNILKAADKLIETYTKGGKLMLCGNGGSAADAQHIAAEFIIRMSHEINRPSMPAIALTTDSSTLTAGGNDLGFENVFARIVQGIGNQGDVLIAISTSGNSPNVLNAVRMAKSKNIFTVGFLGGDGGRLKEETDLNITIPATNTQRIQEGHITVGHILCEIVEKEMYG